MGKWRYGLYEVQTILESRGLSAPGALVTMMTIFWGGINRRLLLNPTESRSPSFAEVQVLGKRQLFHHRRLSLFRSVGPLCEANPLKVMILFSRNSLQVMDCCSLASTDIYWVNRHSQFLDSLRHKAMPLWHMSLRL